MPPIQMTYRDIRIAKGDKARSLVGDILDGVTARFGSNAEVELDESDINISDGVDIIVSGVDICVWRGEVM